MPTSVGLVDSEFKMQRSYCGRYSARTKGFFLRDTKVQAEFLECIRCGVNAFLELKKLLQLITLFRDLTIDQFQLFVRRKAISKIHAHHKIPFGFPGLHLSAKIALK